MIDNEEYIQYKQNFINDEPVELFDGLLVYPVLMKNYIEFSLCSNILKMNKNNCRDPKIISMSYLEYIIYLLIEEDIRVGKGNPNIIEIFLLRIISLVTRDENVKVRYGVDTKNKPFLYINNIKLYKKDFDYLRRFIMVQNIPDYKEEYINPELEEDLKKAEEIRNRDKKMCDIEKQMIAVVIGSSLTLEDVKNMTIRKFFIALEMIDKKMHYIMAKTASLSGFVEFKEEINHYLIEKNKDISDNIIDYTQFKNKINGQN